MRRSEGKHLLVAVASLEPLAKQTLLKLLAEEEAKEQFARISPTSRRTCLCPHRAIFEDAILGSFMSAPHLH
jgi:hypothetical protein